MSAPTVDNKGFWDRFARIYDPFTAHFSPEYPVLVQRIARDVQEARLVLEVATGTGLIALGLGPEQRVDAVDISPGMITQAREKGQALGADFIRFLVSSAYNLPWPDGRYDAVICANALHVMEHPGQALDEIKRVLKNGGRLVAPTFCHGENRRARTISRLMRLGGFKTYTRFTAASLETLFEEHGFSIVTADESDEPIPLCYIVLDAAFRPRTLAASVDRDFSRAGRAG